MVLFRTTRNLHSHLHEGPVTKKHFQVTGYGTVSTPMTRHSALRLYQMLTACHISTFFWFLEWLRRHQWPVEGGGVRRSEGWSGESVTQQSPFCSSSNWLCALLFRQDSAQVVNSLAVSSKCWFVQVKRSRYNMCLHRGWEQGEVTCSPYLKETPNSQWNIEDHINPKCTSNTFSALL